MKGPFRGIAVNLGSFVSVQRGLILVLLCFSEGRAEEGAGANCL